MVALDPASLLNFMVALQNTTNNETVAWNTKFRDHGPLAKAFHGITLGLSVIVFVITLPLLILRRNYQPLKAFSFPIQTFQLFAMMITLNYLNILVLVGVKRFPCWLDNILEYGLLYVYLCITVWRVIRIYSVFQAVFMKIRVPTAKSPSAKLGYQRAARFFDFLGSKFFIIFAGVLGIIHLVEIILAEVIIAAPHYDPKIPEQGCYYYAVGGGIEDLLSTVFALADVVGYAILMIIFTVLLLFLRIKDTYGVVLGIFFTWSHLIIGAIYFVSVRLIFALIPSTAVGAGTANFEVLNSTNIFAFGMVLDMIINITVPAIRTYFWKQASGDKSETAEGFDISSVGFFLPGSPNEDAVRIFKNYATKELSVENVIFFEYFHLYKTRTTPETRRSMTLDIFVKFFSNDALFPLNVAATYTSAVSDKVESIQTATTVEDFSIFDEVAQAVQQNCFDTFIRFSKTTEYKAFVAKNASDVENAKSLKKIGWEYQQLKATSAGTPTQAGNASPTSPNGSPSILGSPTTVTPTTPQI